MWEGTDVLILNRDLKGGIETDDGSETSDITLMTFHAEQLQEQFHLKEFGSMAVIKTKANHSRHRRSDSNVSKLTNVGVLEVEFGRRTISANVTDQDYDLADPSKDQTNDMCVLRNASNKHREDSTHDNFLLKQIIELKLQLAQQRAVNDQLMGKCERLQLENDQLKKQSDKLDPIVQTAGEVDVDSPTFVEVENCINQDSNAFCFANKDGAQRVHPEGEKVISSNPSKNNMFDRLPVLEPVMEYLQDEIVRDKKSIETSRCESGLLLSGLPRRFRHRRCISSI